MESSAALEEGGRHSRGMLWGMGQMGPVLVSVSFTLNSVIKRVTKSPSVNPVRGCVILTQWLVHQRMAEVRVGGLRHERTHERTR